MRQLNAKQKRMLEEFYRKHKISNVDDTRGMTTQQLKEINDIFDVNPHETFYWNANTYLWDECVWKEVYG